MLLRIWGGLRSVGSMKLQVSFAEYCLFHRSLLKETYNFIDPTSRSHPISKYLVLVMCVVGIWGGYD